MAKTPRKPKENLAPDDLLTIRKSKRNFLVVFMTVLFFLFVVIGTFLPFFQFYSNDNLMLSFLSRSINSAENVIPVDPDASLLKLSSIEDADTTLSANDTFENDSETYPYFVCYVTKKSLAGQAIDANDVFWFTGQDSFTQLIFESDMAPADFFQAGRRRYQNVILICEDDGKGRMFLAGSDQRDFLKTFTQSTALLESALALAYVVLCLLASSLADMVLKPVKQNLANQRAFIADASHELKTPLATISASCDVLMKEGQTPNQAKWISTIKDQSLRLSHMVNELLTLSRVESTGAVVNNVNVAALVNDVCLSFDAVCYEAGIQYDFTPVEGAYYCLCNADDLRKLIEELFGNAIKYASGPKPFISISLAKNGNELVFGIVNSGCDFTSEQVPSLFSRFYRLDNQRAGEKSGAGLGLSICKALADKNRFALKVLPEYGKQVTFQIVMALATEKRSNDR